MEETSYFDQPLIESDEEIEKIFLLDFIDFGKHHRSTTVCALLELSKKSNNPLEKQILTISAFTAFISLIEDFSALIYAMHKKREDGTPLLKTLSTYKIPQVLFLNILENKSREEVINYLGLEGYSSINSTKYGISHQKIESTIETFLESLHTTILWQSLYSKAYNWVKHGNTIVSKEKLFQGYDSEMPAVIRYDDKTECNVLTLFPFSDKQLEIFFINSRNISEAMHELILLYLFTQYPDFASKLWYQNH